MPDALRLQLPQKVSELVYGFASAKLDDQKIYQHTARQLPILIHTAGLHKTLRFHKDQTEVEGHKPHEERQAQGEFLEALSQAVSECSFKDFRAQVENAELGEYMYLTRRTLLALEWFKRFSTSLLVAD